MTYFINAAHVERMLGRWQSQGPAYLDLANSVRALIMDGRLPLGSRLPAERGLAPQLNISRNTVTAAYRTLREQGYLQSQRGTGSFIAIPEESRRTSRVASWVPARNDLTAVDFTIASPSAPTEFLHTAMRMIGENSYGDADDAGYDLHGIRRLRRLIADRYTAKGLPTTEDEIMVTAGAQHAWGLLIRLLTRERDHILIDSPTYPNTVDAIRSLNRRPLAVALDSAGWHADLVESVIRRDRPPLGYVMADFHNPTGQVMPDDVRARIVTAAERAGTHLVFDETLTDLALDGDTEQTIPLAQHSENVIMMGSLSKICWAGLRIGWLRAPSPTISQLVSLRAAADAGNSILPQLVACRLLDSYDDLLRERKAVVLASRRVLVDAVRALLPSWTFTTPPGGLSLWVDVGAQVTSRLALAGPAHGVLVLPGARFGVDGTLDDHLRLPFVHDEETTVEGVRRLATTFDAVLNEGGPSGRRRSSLVGRSA